jgi:hypothetical protein
VDTTAPETDFLALVSAVGTSQFYGTKKALVPLLLYFSFKSEITTKCQIKSNRNI